MKKTCIAILLLFIFIVAGCRQGSSIAVNDIAKETAAPLSMKEKLEDFEYMYKILEENYPFFEVNKRMNGIDWLANKGSYRNRINGAMTEQQYKDVLEKILAELNNGHTGIVNKEFYHLLLAAMKPDQGMWKPWLDQLNMSSAVRRYTDGDKKPVESTNKTSSTGSFVAADNVNTRLLLDKKVAYLEIKSLNTFNIETDLAIIKPFFQSIKDYEALIIDIRQNGGGNSDYWSRHVVPMLISKPIQWNKYFVYRGGAFSEPFIKSKLGSNYDELKPIDAFANEGLLRAPAEVSRDFKYYVKAAETIEPKDSINFKGQIYLLVDREVYSSSEMWASFAKSTGFATLVGETTGGDGIGSDPLVCTLPNSGYVVRFPLVLGLTEDGSCNEEEKTVPDIEVAAAKTSDSTKDAAIQYVLDLYK